MSSTIHTQGRAMDFAIDNVSTLNAAIDKILRLETDF